MITAGFGQGIFIQHVSIQWLNFVSPLSVLHLLLLVFNFTGSINSSSFLNQKLLLLLLLLPPPILLSLSLPLLLI